jgi:hypothetical protein
MLSLNLLYSQLSNYLDTTKKYEWVSPKKLNLRFDSKCWLKSWKFWVGTTTSQPTHYSWWGTVLKCRPWTLSFNQSSAFIDILLLATRQNIAMTLSMVTSRSVISVSRTKPSITVQKKRRKKKMICLSLQERWDQWKRRMNFHRRWLIIHVKNVS